MGKGQSPFICTNQIKNKACVRFRARAIFITKKTTKKRTKTNMCLFPSKIKDTRSIQYRSGLRYYNCGSCPECLKQKAKKWALRAYFESLEKPSCMITLTYNDLILDKKKNCIGETAPSKPTVDKRDVQLFIKRLRKALPNNKIKYLVTAEYGPKTKRPHYHAIIFGYDFPDRTPFKKSKRGNTVYLSGLLARTWKNGYCTVDCVKVSPAVVSYCTKYAVKDSGNSDTFMLFSHKIGNDNLLRAFNGKNYIISGREYPIPGFTWYEYIQKTVPQYDNLGELIYSNKYVSQSKNIKLWRYYNEKRRAYKKILLQNPIYQDYRMQQYINQKNKPYISISKRLDLLNTEKYGAYKIQVLRTLELKAKGYNVTCPRNTKKNFRAFLAKELYDAPNVNNFTTEYEVIKASAAQKFKCAYVTCHIGANDTILQKISDIIAETDSLLSNIVPPNFDFASIYS